MSNHQMESAGQSWKRVLVVDDQYGIRLLLNEILKKEGLEALLASTGQQALEFVREKRPGLALVDMRIPGMNGVDILKKIKEINPEVKVMIMTAYGDDQMIREAKKNGAIAYFSKPFDIEKLLAAIHQQLPLEKGNS
ncbi:MAG: response regulator [Sporolactobacillus sp.]